MTRNHHKTAYVPYFQDRPKFCPTTVSRCECVCVPAVCVRASRLVTVTWRQFHYACMCVCAHVRGVRVCVCAYVCVRAHMCARVCDRMWGVGVNGCWYEWVWAM
jgi:hypothetical protein